ncbi:MAG: nickel pincer cofactor biosynthesis protein LarB [Acidobacteriota bacterium]|nr:nickel pincer cofactor biosynthesis protein LarB [Blastocatellia bacterium]MDW8412207.1 nickel pincer cofactor biosynthesis protein LarB [Acidobacteriota bacterium]
MHRELLKQLLAEVQSGELSVEQALEKLKLLPYEDLSFAKVDHHRSLRQDLPEVIFAMGKTTDQVVSIAERIVASGTNLLITRVTPETAEAVQKVLPKACYHKLARVITLRTADLTPATRGTIGIVAAGTADLAVAEEAAVTAEFAGNSVERFYDVGVAGLHRLLSITAKLQQMQVIVCVAGMEAALPSVVGGLVAVPVIAVPTSIGYGAHFSGLAALLGALNSCSSNVTVVNIDNGFGAGFVATLINRK